MERAFEGHDTETQPPEPAAELGYGQVAQPAEDDAATVSLRQQLAQAESARHELEQRLGHKVESADRIREANAALEGRVAELEGMLTGTEAVRARAQAEREEVERRMTLEMSELQRQHDEQLSAGQYRIDSLALLLQKQEEETDRTRAEHSQQLETLERQLVEEQAQAADQMDGLRSEVEQARSDLKPRAARKVAALQSELDDERTRRAELERQVADLTESQRALEQELEQRGEVARARIAELEPALEQARSECEWAAREFEDLTARFATTDAARLEREGELDIAERRVAELERLLVEAQAHTEVLEGALETVSTERDGIEAARRSLEARMAARDEADQVALAEREAERRTARSHDIQLTRAERRMRGIASDLASAIGRLGANTEIPGAPEPAEGAPPADAAQSPPAPPQSAADVPLDEASDPPISGDAAQPEPDPTTSGERTIVSGFLDSAQRFAAQPAVRIEGATISYGDLRDRAERIAATLLRERPAGDSPMTAVFARHSATAFAGLLGILMRGHGCVRLDRSLSVGETRSRFERSGCQAIVADASSARLLPELLGSEARGLLLLVPDLQDPGGLRRSLPGCRVLAADELQPAASWRPLPIDLLANAYLDFTTATGELAGVTMSHGEVLQHVDSLAHRYGLVEDESQGTSSDIAFGDSVFDLFVAWEHGACVDVPN